MKNKPNESEKEISVHSILSGIQSGTLDPLTMTRDVRMLCVETLILEGYAPPAMAQLFKVSDKTIRRDVKEIHEKNSLKPSAELATQLIGDFLIKSRAHHAHLLRLARSKEASIQEKIYAESAAAQVSRDTIKTLQSLGYLPSRPQEIIADFFHHTTDDEESFQSLRLRIAEMESLARELGGFKPDLAAKLEGLKERLTKAEVQHEVLKLTQAQKGTENE